MAGPIGRVPQSPNPVVESALFWFQKTERLGAGAIAQIEDKDLMSQVNPECNNIVALVQHLTGSYIARWRRPFDDEDDGRDRKRDLEFVSPPAITRDELMAEWKRGWDCFYEALNSFTPEDLGRKITYGGQQYPVLFGLFLQLQHSSYHVGQIVHIAKTYKGEDWETLSIPRAKP